MRFTRSRTPLTVIFNLTEKCNSSCKHCFIARSIRHTANEMSTEQVRELILDLRNNGCLRISFSGGEPLLREDIGEIIGCAKKIGMSVTVNSNGMLVPERINLLKRLDSLAISLDGSPEHHDILRGNGTGKKAILAIKSASEAGIKVYINMVLNRFNLNDIDFILALAKRYNSRVEFNLAISNIFGEGITPDEFKPTNESFRKALGYIVKKKKEGEPVLFSAAAYEGILRYWEDFSVEGVFNKTRVRGLPECAAGKFFCTIDASGNLWPCPHLIEKIDFRNALEVGVSEAWRTAASHNCVACYQVYHHEFARLASLDPRVVWNYFKTAIAF